MNRVDVGKRALYNDDMCPCLLSNARPKLHTIGRGKSSNNGWRRFAPFRVYGARSIMQNYDGVERPLLSDGIYMALLDVAMTC